MKCYYCQTETSISNLMFVDDGMVPGIQMKRRRAHCGCPLTIAIDGKPSEKSCGQCGDTDPAHNEAECKRLAFEEQVSQTGVGVEHSIEREPGSDDEPATEEETPF